MISKPRIDYFKSEMEPYFDWQLKQLVWASPCSLRYFNAICDLDPPKENIQVWLIENRNLPPNHAEFIGQISHVDADLFNGRWSFAGMNISEALDALQDYQFVRRLEWADGEALSLDWANSTDWTSDRMPWLMHHSHKGIHYWFPTQSDLWKKDWMVVSDANVLR